MGHNSGTPPVPGGAGGFTPAHAKKFFEFFPTGCHREVLLLGDLAEQLVHWVKSKGHKVLCGSRTGHCDLCQLAPVSDDVGTRQVEYLAPAFVRPKRQKQFDQRVVVFSAAAGEAVLSKLSGQGLPARGQIVDVEAKKHGPRSCRYVVNLLPGLPPDLTAALPPAFDLVPFVRGRFGRDQVPGQLPVFLEPFKAVGARPAFGRPQPLSLTAADCAPPTDEERAKARELLKAHLARTPQSAEQPEATSPPTSPAAPAATSPPASPPAAPAAAPNPAPAPAPRSTFRPSSPPPPAEPDQLGEVVGDLVNRFRLSDDPVRVDGDIDRHVYGRPVQRGPRIAVYQPPTAADEDAALNRRIGEQVCDELKAKRNGKPHATGTGGAK